MYQKSAEQNIHVIIEAETMLHTVHSTINHNILKSRREYFVSESLQLEGAARGIHVDAMETTLVY